jgi:hypothetical protein
MLRDAHTCVSIPAQQARNRTSGFQKFELCNASPCEKQAQNRSKDRCKQKRLPYCRKLVIPFMGRLRGVLHALIDEVKYEFTSDRIFNLVFIPKRLNYVSPYQHDTHIFRVEVEECS